MKSIQKKNISSTTLILIAGAILFVVLFVYAALELQESEHFNAQTLSHFLTQLGPVASIIYIFIMILAVITPIPDSLVTVAGGFIFGPVMGSLFALVGLAIGTSFDFFIARMLGREFVARKFPNTIEVIDRFAKKSGWWTVFIMRVLPSVTFDLIGYSAGISSMPYIIYLGATLLGAVPMTLFTIFLGDSLHIKSLHYSLAVIFGGIIFVSIGSYVAHRLHISSLSLQKRKVIAKLPHVSSYYISLLKKRFKRR